MRRNLLPLVLGCLGVTLMASGCSQPPWGKLVNPFSSAAHDLPGLDPGVAQPAAANGQGNLTGVKNPLALAELSECQGRSEQAERLYLEIINQSPDNPVPYHRLGVMYTKQGKFKEAGERFGRALALTPDAPEVLNDAGYFYYLAANMGEAERCLRRVLQLQPENVRCCTNLAMVLGEQGRDAECLALLRRASPTGNQAQLNFAYVLVQRGEYRHAMDIYDRVLTEDPSQRVAADAMIELSKYAPRKTLLPPPLIPTTGPAQMACNSPEANPNPWTGPAWAPQPGPVAQTPPQPQAPAWASQSGPGTSPPGYAPGSLIPSYTSGPTNAAQPVSYCR